MSIFQFSRFGRICQDALVGRQTELHRNRLTDRTWSSLFAAFSAARSAGRRRQPLTYCCNVPGSCPAALIVATSAVVAVRSKESLLISRSRSTAHAGAFSAHASPSLSSRNRAQSGNESVQLGSTVAISLGKSITDFWTPTGVCKGAPQSAARFEDAHKSGGEL